MAERRKFRREGEEARRDALIEAALSLVAEGGSQAATVRAIALRAGVTPGLIRHYFTTKEELIATAYAVHMDRMTEDSAAVLALAPDCPRAQIASFVAAALSPPVVDTRGLGLWAGFLNEIQRDARMRSAHRAGYLAFRDRLEALIAAAMPDTTDRAILRRHAIACNAVIDGLWLEASALPEAFDPGEVARIGVVSVGAIIGVDLSTAAAPGTDRKWNTP